MQTYRIILVTLIVLFTLSNHVFGQTKELAVDKQYSLAMKHNNDGNYRQAYELFRAVSFHDNTSAVLAAEALEQAVRCLGELKAFKEFDEYLELLIEKRADDWQVLHAAANRYLQIYKFGSVVAGEFNRGNSRGQARYVTTYERDRTRALQLLRNAINLVNKENKSVYSSLLLTQVNALQYQRARGNAWKLQHLTDLSRLPDFEDRQYGYHDNPGAPVDVNGKAIFYKSPKSVDSAVNDGERLRFALAQKASHSVNDKIWADWIWADFLWSQFGVQSLAQTELYRQLNNINEVDAEKSIYSLHKLTDKETIAKLASGIQRFSLDSEYNFINILKSIAEPDNNSGYGQLATERLAQIYENRRQLKTAAHYWKLAIERYDIDSHSQKRLDQIVGAWARFEPGQQQVAGGQQQKVTLRYRNGENLSLQAYELKTWKFIADIKNYLKQNPKRLNWQETQLEQLGYKIIHENEKQYIGHLVKSWKQKLSPSKQHFDRQIEIDFPVNAPGAYLLKATIAGGNTSHIIVWKSDAIIVKKPMGIKDFYYVADALTGQALPNSELEFFGYDQVYIDKQKQVSSERSHNFVTQEHTYQTDQMGQLVLDKRQLDPKYRWLVTTKNEHSGFAYLGFSSIWFNKHNDSIYKQSKAFIISSQPVYRPGNDVKFNIWVREAKYDKDDTSRFTNQKFTLEITNPRNEKVFEQLFTADEYGGFSGQFSLPENAVLGNYGIRISNKSSKSILGSAGFRVEEYKKPEYEVTVETVDKPQMLGEKITATIKANYYFGAPVTSATVKYKVLRYDHESLWYPTRPWDWLYGVGYWWFAGDYPWYPGWRHWGLKHPHPYWRPVQHNPPEEVQVNEQTIGKDGTVTIEIDTSITRELRGDKDHRYEIVAEVVDESRRTIVGRGEVLLSRKPYTVYAWVDKGYYQSDDVVKANFAAKTLDQKPVQGKGSLKLYRIQYGENNQPEEQLVQQWLLDTDKQGSASLQFKVVGSGQFRLSYTVSDKQDNHIEGGYLFNVMGIHKTGESFRFNELELIADKAEYKANDQLKLMINSQGKNATVLLFLRPVDGVYHKPEIIQLNANSLVRNISITKQDMPNFFVEALTIQNGKVYSEIKKIIVPPEKRFIKVEIVSEKNRYKPGEKSEITVKLTDHEGQPFTGSIVIAVYDKSLEYISGGSNVTDIRHYFWRWQRSHYPNTTSSADHYFRNLLKANEITLQSIGIFGDRLLSSDQEAKEEISIVGNSIAYDSIKEQSSPALLRRDHFSRDAKFSMSSVSAPPVNKSPVNVPVVHIRKAFADSAYWNAGINTDKNGKATIGFTMPENLTDWKVSVWAMGHGTKVGEAKTSLVTSKDLLLRLQAPRFFVEKDEVVLSANIHNYLSKSANVRTELQLPDGNLGLISDNNQQLSIENHGEQRVDWRVKVLKEGTATIRMLAISGEESDAMEMEFPVYVHGMLKTDSFSGALNRKQNKEIIHFSVPKERREQQSRFELRYSPTLAGALVDALPYLADYPYGCTEQTLNRFLPVVITQNILKRTGVDLKKIKNKQSNLNAQEIGDDRERAVQWQNKFYPSINPVFDEEQLASMVSVGLQRLYSMQSSDGGWGWFSGWGEHSSAHMTAYVMHGLQMAKGNDLVVDNNSFRRGLDWLVYYQSQEIQKLKNADSKTKPYKIHVDNLDAFVTMVLAENGKSNSAMTNYLYQDRTALSVYGKSMLGLILHQEKRTTELTMLMENIRQHLVMDEENQTAYLELGNSHYWWYWYGSEFESHAYYLKLLAKLEPNSEIAPRLVKYLLNNRRHAHYWNSTRDTALIIEAMADYLLASNEIDPDVQLDIQLDGKLLKTVKINSKNLFDYDNKLVLKAWQLSAGEHEIQLRKQGESPLYYNAYLNNFTLEDFINKAGLEVKVDRHYYLLKKIQSTAISRGSDGQVIEQGVEEYKRIAIDQNHQLLSGDLVEVELTLDSKNDYEYVLIEDMKAAGFEPVEVRSGYNGNDLGAYVEFRDNRVAFFVKQLARGKHSVSYRLRAETPGKFSALPARLELMYAPEIKANSDEGKFLIQDQ